MRELLGVEPVAFSFHNPDNACLSFDEEEYGGLVNCYSWRFKHECGYCSDSNGYWRFHRLYDVLSQARDQCLQVLTHPGWWQKAPMPPRQRVFRCVYGRAAATLHAYDNILEKMCRRNRGGLPARFQFIKEIDSSLFDLCDYLWNSGHLRTLFLELFRFHKLWLRNYWQKHKMLSLSDILELLGIETKVYQYWQTICNQLVQGDANISDQVIEDGCEFLSLTIEALSKFQ